MTQTRNSTPNPGRFNTRAGYDGPTVDHLYNHVEKLKSYPNNGVGYFAAFYACEGTETPTGACSLPQGVNPDDLRMMHRMHNFWDNDRGMFDQLSVFDVIELLPYYYNKKM